MHWRIKSNIYPFINRIFLLNKKKGLDFYMLLQLKFEDNVYLLN